MIKRRLFLGGCLVLPLAGCDAVRDMAYGRRSYANLSRPERLVRWLNNTGRDNMMSPEALGIMGLTRPNNMDIPVKQIAETGGDGRYTLSLIGYRGFWEFVFHQRAHDSDVLMFHHADKNIARLSSVRFQRNQRPVLVTDVAFAEADFQKQQSFWFDRMPGR